MDPYSTAVLLIGFQNDYFAPDGILHSVIEASATTVKTVEHTTKLLRSLMGSGVLVISTPIFFTSSYEELVEPVGILKTIKEVGAFQKDGRGSETIAEFGPFREQILEIPGKRGLNAFINTNLNDILRQRDITQLVIAGAVTSVCIDSTGRSAYEQGYQVSVLSDCTSARTTFEQEFYFENVFPLYAKPMSSLELLEQLRIPALC
ncbi:MAG: isochorismatase family cysteine hydrolase [Cyanobacteria bacterium P01_F01_bin.150]